MKEKVLNLLIVEDNERLRKSLIEGMKEFAKLKISYDCAKGEEAIDFALKNEFDVLLADVRLAGTLSGIETIVAIRKEYPRKPVVIYSIQDSDEYFRSFRKAGILSHYAYVRKSNYLLPQMIVPLIELAYEGKSFIDPEIETRIVEVKDQDENSPMAILEPNEKIVAKMLGEGLSNEQIAARLGFKDKRTISRINGQIYAAWDLNESNSDEKVARTRAALIVRENRFLQWEEDGNVYYRNGSGDWIRWESNLEL
ncbi:response regulator receiver domain protein [Leptospira interrogans str. 2003000735]|uniref:Response regulator receiver domain protein n=4 Tax=Leptospira interrogans TaxID=173 RepID=M3H2C0_LEPIR|nr:MULTISPECIES: response regulator transcription factor [Leptospira]EMG13108.1 response regulator receiver domain protein [Leptospira interrogans serovar Grippotyphosa str. LT2186]EMM80311.1 response regulator receiver domain protein [Leptospira interrogans str. 2006001854]EMY03574.1 response regulator receiver domain protein [Leptospira interrogans str. 2002000626]EMY27590.1 response regulator receiver domain protein [Leptospira interrogans serovar Australis str. 200703203]AJR12936.1 two-com